ncbi:MAG: YciI family protein [Byssovorax sp.]
MHYAILCYNHEAAIGTTWPKASEEAVMAHLATIQDKLTREGKLVSAARLDRTTTATTLKKSPVEQLVLDGPFAETKEQLLGFYIVECGSMEEALSIARELSAAVPVGSYEIRPMRSFARDQRAP